MHPLTYWVYQAIPLLELERFRHFEEDREWAERFAQDKDDQEIKSRLDAIRTLAQEQVRDDQDTLDRREDHHFSVFSVPVQEGSIPEGMWGRRSQRYLALEAGLAPLLDSGLTAEQRVLVRLRYDRGETFPEIAERLGTTKQAVEQRFKTIHKKLRAALLLAYGPREEVQDAE